MQPDAFERPSREQAPDRRGREYLRRSRQVSPTVRTVAPLPFLAIAAAISALLFAAVLGCSPAPADPQPRPLVGPIVKESYAVDDENRPLTEEELDAAFARLQADEAAFLSDLEKAPPVRQASLIFVLQRNPSAAREHRDLLERLSTSSHGIVRRAALFALEAADEEPAAVP